MPRQDDPVDAERGSASQDRAEVVWILHVVDDEHEAAPSKPYKTDVADRVALSRHALVPVEPYHLPQVRPGDDGNLDAT